METFGTARLADDIPAERAITAVVSRGEFAAALQDPERSPELYLDIDRQGEERSTIGISWSNDELEKLLERASGDDILLTFDRDELQSVFDDVEAHGLRQKALIFTVAAAGALGSGATIANAAPSIDRGSDGAASVAAVQTMAADSIVTDGGTASNVRTPGLQIGDAASTAAPVVADDGTVSNAHTPGLQIGDAASTATTPSVQVSVPSSSSEFLGVPSRDITDGLIAGGVMLAIAGAGFAGSRRMGTPRPA